MRGSDLRRLALAIALGVGGCAPAYYTGVLDLTRAERGEVYLDPVALPDGQFMVRGVVIIDAPAQHLWNLVTDYENIPLWDPLIVSVQVKERHGDVVVLAAEMRPMFLMSLVHTEVTVRADPVARELSLDVADNDLLRSAKVLLKIEPYGAGDRTLVNLFSRAEPKIATFLDLFKVQANTVIDTVKNIRKVVHQPRYAEPTPGTLASPAVAARRRVILRGLSADGFAPDLVRTVERVFADQLTRASTWSVLTEDEVLALLSYAGQQQLAGCTQQGPCVADLGQVLEAEHLINGSLTRVGELLVLSAAVVRISDGTVEGRTVVEAKGEAALVDRAREAALQLAK